MREAVELLYSYGPCTVIAALALAIVYLYCDFKSIVAKKDKTIEEMGATHHNEIVAVVRECTAVLVTVTKALERVEEVLNRRNE